MSSTSGSLNKMLNYSIVEYPLMQCMNCAVLWCSGEEISCGVFLFVCCVFMFLLEEKVMYLKNNCWDWQII